ncbi:MAG: hypothetical protein ABJA80_15565 [bacterium]
MPASLPPFALSAPVFRFRHLAALAGRAPIGGSREVALACFVAARLAADAGAPAESDATGRAERCAGAKAWIGTLALPAPVRGAVARCADLSMQAAPGELGREVAGLLAAATSYLDAQSRSELTELALGLRA